MSDVSGSKPGGLLVGDGKVAMVFGAGSHRDAGPRAAGEWDARGTFRTTLNDDAINALRWAIWETVGRNEWIRSTVRPRRPSMLLYWVLAIAAGLLAAAVR